MAERVVHQLFDDIDGTEIIDGHGQQVAFSLHGVNYHIDLSSSNVAKLEKALQRYIHAATIVPPAGRRVARSGGIRNQKSPPEQLAAIRAWARKNGFDVADRGRIKAEIIRAFDAAH
ncbi:hypothetical protein EB72_08405 [Mycobacterium sp. SWH-M1]|nr:hypothetical protein EB72_08405 [Mycobacterium sp. SWH-M1]